jgi:hypothetical protein
MSIDSLLTPNIWTNIKPNSIDSNTIEGSIVTVTDELWIQCDDNNTVNFTPESQGNVGDVLTRVGVNRVEFLPPAGSGGSVTNPLDMNLAVGSFDVVGLVGGETLNGLAVQVPIINTRSIENEAKLEYITTGANVTNLSSSINMQNNSIASVDNINATTIGCDTINNIRASGGLFMTTSQSNIVLGTTETDIIAGATFQGSLSASFLRPSAFHLNIAGLFSAVNSSSLIIKLKSNGIVIGTITTALVSVANQFFEIECDFSVRSLGPIGGLNTSFEFTYSDSGSSVFRGDREVLTTTINTTISNTLSVTAQFVNNNAINALQATQVVLVKTY